MGEDELKQRVREQKRKSEKMRHLRRERAGQCVRCGKTDERTRAGKTVCASCAAKERERYRRRIEQPGYREALREYNRRYVDKRRAAGLCLRCGNPAGGGYTLCMDCRIRDSERRKERLLKEKMEVIRNAAGAGDDGAGSRDDADPAVDRHPDGRAVHGGRASDP